MTNGKRCWKCGELPMTATELYSKDAPVVCGPVCEACDIGHVFHREVRMQERERIQMRIAFLEEKLQLLKEKEAS